MMQSGSTLLPLEEMLIAGLLSCSKISIAAFQV